MDITTGVTGSANSPIWPGALSTGPLLCGNIINTTGTSGSTSSLAGAGQIAGSAPLLANVGYVSMWQYAPVSQTTFPTILPNGTPQTTGVFQTGIVIPAQSLIVEMNFFITTVWSGASNQAQIADTTGTTYNAAVGITPVGLKSITVGTKARTQVAQNVGSTDVQLTVVNTNVGNGLGILFVRYVQGCNVNQSQ